jgi:hypothetical protein
MKQPYTGILGTYIAVYLLNFRLASRSQMTNEASSCNAAATTESCRFFTNKILEGGFFSHFETVSTGSE